MSALDQIRHALGAASASNDPELRAIYTSVARSLFASAESELKQLGLLLDAREREIVRLGEVKR